MPLYPLEDDATHAAIWTSLGGIRPAWGAWQGAVANPTSTAWPSANAAFLVPFVVSTPTTFVEMFFVTGTTPGTTNYDLGLYRDDFTRIASLGATAAANTTDTLLPVGGGSIGTVTLPRGRYYMAMSSAATTLTVRALAPTNQLCRALGMFQMAAAHPLPATITPASMGATTFIPTIGLATVPNVL